MAGTMDGVTRAGVTALLALVSASLATAPAGHEAGALSRGAVRPPSLVLAQRRSSIGAVGGLVAIRFRVAYGVTCTLLAVPGVRGWPTSFPCRNADVVRDALIPPNRLRGPERYVLWVSVTNATATTRRGEVVEQAGATPSPRPVTVAPTLSRSMNWSGYVVPSSGVVTRVLGEWTVPLIDCGETPDGRVATWVGIGGALWPSGADSGPLLQTGVVESCAGAAQRDSAFVERWPSGNGRVRYFDGLVISPGDSVEGSVYHSHGGRWVTRIDDLTTGVSGWALLGSVWGVERDGASAFLQQGSLGRLAYPGGDTAEWIVEDGTEGGGTLFVFGDYGSVTFSHLVTSLPSWSLAAGDAVRMVQGGVAMSTPSAPAGDSFTVSYTGRLPNYY